MFINTCYQTVVASENGEKLRLLRTGSTVTITFSSNNPLDLVNGFQVYTLDPNGIPVAIVQMYLNDTWTPSTNQNYMITYSPAGWGIGGLSFEVEFYDPIPLIQYPPTPILNTWPPEYRNNKQNCVEFGNSIPYLPDFDGLCKEPIIRLEVQPHNEPGLPQSFNPDNYSFPYYGPIPNINDPANCIQENSDPNGMPVQNCLTVKMIFTIEPCPDKVNCDPFEFEVLVQFCCDCKVPLPFLPPYSHD